MGRDRESGRSPRPGETREFEPDGVHLREGEEPGRRTTDARVAPGETSRVRARGSSDEGTDGGGVPHGDSARWGPIWAGLVTAIATYLLLQLLVIGIGLQQVGPATDGGGGWVAGLVGLVAFFTGGAVAGMTSAVRGTGTGLLNGFLVWALGTVLILVLSAFGLGQVFGALGNVAGQLGNLQGITGGAQAPDVDAAQAAEAIRNGAIGAFFALLLSALAAMAGGWLGGDSREPIGRQSGSRGSR